MNNCTLGKLAAVSWVICPATLARGSPPAVPGGGFTACGTALGTAGRVASAIFVAAGFVAGNFATLSLIFACTCGSPGTICGICWIAPNAAPYEHANMIVVMIVVRASSGEKIAARLGRRIVPDNFFNRHAGDSGRNGRMMISGIAGMSPEISVYRHAA